ncbi:hypothetical protein BDZ45DRAFT_736816 [Acephala macrosclerotiorum]|nr:hypothetical protein BDZ45DRAFT_736816 [Acephala macrosclerotiorum]
MSSTLQSSTSPYPPIPVNVLRIYVRILLILLLCGDFQTITTVLLLVPSSSSVCESLFTPDHSPHPHHALVYSLRIRSTHCRSIFWSCIGNSTSELIVAGIFSGLNRHLGHASWRWLFIIEGAASFAFRAVAIFALPGFPESTTGSTEWLFNKE